ncbi:MAG: glycosyltransferase family 2 protein [Candidatus Omnitrophica bacterium]|nr:glycosyltransferase family 2 protein [Candidatus Omnitrophota bacterium]
MNKVPLSVVVIAKNEEANIDSCLGSVHGWADEIILVDDESTDRTVEAARKYTGRVLRRKMENEGVHRNWAHAQARNPWVLILDADEQATPELKQEIARSLSGTPHSCFSIPLKTYIGTTWIRHSGWYPASKIRLFQKEHFKYEEVGVHPRAFLAPGKTEGHLTRDIIHQGYPDIEHFLASVNRQTTLEAQKWIATGRKMSPGQALWRMVDRFPRRYVRKKGYKDGLYGFVIAFFDSFYQLMSYLKYLEMKRK